MSERVGRWTRLARWAPFTIAILAIASSINGITNRFTYDDRYIVELNPAMKDIAHWWRSFATSYWPKSWGGDGYRPLTILMFKIETWIGHGSTVPFHATNILLYAIASVLVLLLARRLLPPWAAWLAAALFAVHPVHVEAVANVVGQSELLVAVALLSAVTVYLRDRQNGTLTFRTGAIIALCYAVGCLAKEHAIVLPALLGVAELTVIDDGRSIRERLGDRRIRILYLSLVAVAVAFVSARSLVLADHGLGGFQPFTPFSALKIGTFDRILTAIGVVPEWIRLLLWPARLSSEYGPPDIPIAQGVAVWQVPGFLLLFAVLAICVVVRRRQPVISFGIAVLCVALLPSSNFVIPAGIVLAERTLFLPSVGAMLAVGGIAVVVAKELTARFGDRAVIQRVSMAAIALVLAAGVTRSVLRTRVWKDNTTLFYQAVVDSPDSYRAHYMLGAYQFEQKQNRVGELSYRKALNLFPYDPYLSYNLAEQYRKFGLCNEAIPLYRWTFGLNPTFSMGHSAFTACLLEAGQYAEAKRMAFEVIRGGGEVRRAHRLIFLADSAMAAEGSRRSAPTVATAGSPSKVPQTVQKTP